MHFSDLKFEIELRGEIFTVLGFGIYTENVLNPDEDQLDCEVHSMYLNDDRIMIQCLEDEEVEFVLECLKDQLCSRWEAAKSDQLDSVGPEDN